MEQLLTIGTVVKVQIAETNTLRMVIAGYFPHDKKTDRLYDYAAVMYPWGMQPGPALQMFNHGQIISIEHAGYQDDEGRDFIAKMQEAFQLYEDEVKKALQAVDTLDEFG